MFDQKFVWGVASSAYQVEGTDPEDGRGEMIWDDFLEEGHGYEGQTGAVSCDHMHRYKQDYALMGNLGIQAYRFSLNWARILPDGTGRVNEKAIAMYRDMILTMKSHGIEPYITLFHWEFPKALYHKGGWLNDEVVEWFGNYAKVVAEHFSDICTNFITFNEPQCVVLLGHLTGEHAPGIRVSIRDSFRIAHNLLKSHGQAVKMLRAYAKQPIRIGYAPTGGVAYPETEDPADVAAAKSVYFGFDNPMERWAWNVSWFSDPVFLGHYPKEGLEKFAKYLPEITEADLELIHQPLDFMGQNIYNGYGIRAGADGKPEYVERKPGSPVTAVDWPVTPKAFYYGIKFLCERYPLPLFITENGMGCHDNIAPDGRVHDWDRITFLDEYIGQMQRAMEDGADVRGYFCWTFLDNLEWDKGYKERFGLVYVDYENQRRIVKDSAYWYQKLIATRGGSLSCNDICKEILFLDPVCTHNIWGGTKLREEFNYPVEGDDIGECWGISAHPNGDGSGRYGAYAGWKLSRLWEEHPEVFGNLDVDRFPLLVKLIDARDDLSIQVHPNDSYAKEHENGSFGKTECWYVLDCPENASLVIGHNAKSKEELSQMIAEGRWKEFIREVPVQKGDFIQIDPGTVHAIKGGLLILETQQNSDITYRVYDYDRLSNGKPRELHIQQSEDVITIPAREPSECIIHTKNSILNELVPLYSCDLYSVFHLNLEGSMSFRQKYPFLNMTVTDGSGIINGQPIHKGDNFILPNEFGMVELTGNLEAVLSTADHIKEASNEEYMERSIRRVV
ncbi:MAG: mannose-6-phosphate isomerase, class I [Lachnospiraceae bacterium]|nr:mannose-6-phosphate isomerase, class I [Lachnospiraceae bacterium]